MSPKSINKALDLLGVGFDLPLHNWKEEINGHLEKHSQVKQAKTEIESRKEEFEQQADMGDAVHQLEAAKTTLDGKIEKLPEEQPKSFSIVLDNVDLRVLASDMTSDNQNKDYHWCNHNAYRDRVNPTHLPDDGPTADLQEVPNSTFLPSLTDQKALLNDFTVLIGRVLVENLTAFEIFKDVVPLHIKHKYSDILKNKTETVNVLSCFRNINYIEDITRWREDMNFMFEWQEQYRAANE